MKNYMPEEDNDQARHAVQSYDPEALNPDNCK